MRHLINTIFDMSKFEEAPVMKDATRTEREHLIDAFLDEQPAWYIMELYEETDALDDIYEGIKKYTISGVGNEACQFLAKARSMIRESHNLELDIDDIIYDVWDKR
jgi:hypothetical protein